MIEVNAFVRLWDEELERFVGESKGCYVSVAEVVREAVRDFL